MICEGGINGKINAAICLLAQTKRAGNLLSLTGHVSETKTVLDLVKEKHPPG